MEGQPFVSLVTPATAPDFSVLLFLSALSEHTRHLRADARCSLMVVGAPEGPSPQTAPRLTVTGLAEMVEDAGLKARWLALHPYAEIYAGFADFSLWRMRPMAGLLVAGFARAHRLRQADLAPEAGAVAALEAAGRKHHDALQQRPRRRAGGDRGWRRGAGGWWRWMSTAAISLRARWCAGRTGPPRSPMPAACARSWCDWHAVPGANDFVNTDRMMLDRTGCGR